MILPSIENFLKILRFYQLNDIRTVKDKSKKHSKDITTDAFYESLDFNYEQGSEGLEYPGDEDALRLAINSRLDLSKYFNGAGFPGSYAYNTPDGFRTKSLILDWSSTIKTFQDSTDRVTNAYRLSSEEVDKAILGFGIDFINSRTLPSLDRRQTFLLNICELYKIKGSPQSIIKALNIIGIENCYIQEAWVYPTRDGLKNVEFKWIPVENPQQFDPEKNEYYDDRDDLETEYWSWGYVNDVLAAIKECHWFYKKQEIIDLNWNLVPEKEKTYIHLPSLTPYFNVKIKYNENTQKSLMNNIFNKVGEQFKDYLIGKENPKDCSVNGYTKNISFLELWCAFLYVNISYSDYLRYTSLRKFIKKFAICDIDTDDFTSENKYFNLIYKLYTYYKSLETDSEIYRFKKTLSLYSESSVPLCDLSYSQLKYWWINHPRIPEDDANGLTVFRKIIKPSKIIQSEELGIYKAQIYWNENYPYGYYDIELYINDEKGWLKLEENSKVCSESMQRIINLIINDSKLEYHSLDDLYDKIRIVHYRTEDNIPEIFFDNPFYINSADRDTSMDMLYNFNEKIIHDSLFTKELFHALYEEQNSNIENNITQTDLYQNLIEKFRFFKIRVTDIDLIYKTYFNSLFKYPDSILKEDRDTLYRNAFYEYVIEPTYNYIDYLQHDGENLNYINYDKRYPLNKKWNWAISYGKNLDETYFYLNYEASKWCRFKSFELIDSINIPVNLNVYGTDDYGIPVYENGTVSFKICQQNLNEKSGCYFVIDKDRNLMEDEWNALSYSSKSISYSDNLKEFCDECNLNYNINDNKIEVIVPPSDLYPSTVIQEKTFIVIDQEKQKEVKFYFCDTLIKPYSKMAKEIVVAQISSSSAMNIYDNVVDCYNSNRQDAFAKNNIELSTPIKITYNPYFENKNEKNITYGDLLRYLYINGYTLDINGYIYKRFDYYIDDNNYLYIKCVDLSDVNKSNKDIINFRWIRIKCSRKWENKDTKSIFYRLDNNFEYILDIDGQRISNLYGIPYKPYMSFKNVYDSRRYLSDPILKGSLPDSENVPNDCYDILSISNGTFNCYAKFDKFDKGQIIDGFVHELKIPKYIDKKSVLQNKDSSLLNVVNYGLNQDLLDWIDAQFTKYVNSTTLYEELIVKLCAAIQDYSKQNFGIIESMDIYNNHIFRSRLVVNIINFYKPKRDRMLSLTSSIGIDDYDRVFGDGLNDYEYNKIFLNNVNSKETAFYSKQENGLHNRSRITHEINEYIPFDDLIYLDKDRVETDVNNEREVYPEDSIVIPNLEVFDKVEAFSKYPVNIDDKVVYPSFYCSNIDSRYCGYYYKEKDIDYYCSDYVFMKKEFFFKSAYDLDGTYYEDPIFITLNVWTLVNKINADKNNVFDLIYISESNTTSIPWINQNGDILKYKKINIPSGVDRDIYLEKYFVKDYYLSDLNDVNIKFQLNTENSLYAKINLRDLNPVLYFGNFESTEYNGFYYCTETRYGYPAYINDRGKMICLFDMSMLPDYYLDTYIKDYRTHIQCKRFWILTDYKEIPDFSDAEYFAFEPAYKGKESIFERNNNDILTEKTKTFYKASDVKKSDYLYVTGIIGWNVNILSEHPEYINRLDKIRRKYELPESYKDIVDRRVSQNILPEKYIPVSYINFYFNYSLSDLVDGNYYHVYYKSINDNKDIDLRENRYTFNEYGINLSALHITKDQKLIIEDKYTGINETIVFKAKNNDNPYGFITESDNKWHTYIIRNNNYESNLYVDGKYKESIVYTHSLQIISKDCSISEFAIFDTYLPDWYISIINDYGVFRFRKDVSLGKSVHNKNNKPTFYSRWIFGVPPTTIGDRLNSKYVNYVGDEYFKYPEPKYNLFNTYRWNLLSRYFPEKSCEMSALWEFKLENRIYDRNLIPTFNRNNEIESVVVDSRDYKRFKVELNGNENFYREFDQRMFINGVEYSVPNNYICDRNNIPPWYIKDPSTYKTGDVVHNPVHISLSYNIDDPYPIVKHGEKYISYFDYDHLTDGIELSNSPLYPNQQYDDNTEYVLSRREFISEEEFKSKYNYDVHDYNNNVLENHDNRHPCFCEDVDRIPMYFNPSIINLTQEEKDSHIYHTTIKLKKNGVIDDDVCKTYYLDKNYIKEKYDFDYCYSSIDSPNDNYKHFNDVMVSESKRWKPEGFITENTINICTRNSIVPVYYDESGYYSWELRQYFIYLYNAQNIDVNTLDDNQLIKNVKTPVIGFIDGSDFNYSIAVFIKKIAFTYIKSNYYVPYQNKDYNFINQFQFDICGQKLCRYKSDVGQLLKENHVDYIDQEVIHNTGFINYDTIKLQETKNTREYPNNKFNYNGRFYLSNNGVYIHINENWYGPFSIKSKKISSLPEQLKDVNCLDIVYTQQNLYVKTQKQWVNINFSVGTISKKALVKIILNTIKKTLFWNTYDISTNEQFKNMCIDLARKLGATVQENPVGMMLMSTSPALTEDEDEIIDIDVDTENLHKIVKERIEKSLSDKTYNIYQEGIFKQMCVDIASIFGIRINGNSSVTQVSNDNIIIQIIDNTIHTYLKDKNYNFNNNQEFTQMCMDIAYYLGATVNGNKIPDIDPNVDNVTEYFDNRLNELFIADNKFFINVVYTDKDLPEWSYYIDKANILQTLRIFKDNNFNLRNKNENNFVNGFVNKQTITDYLLIYAYYLCQFPVNKICLCKDEECMISKDPKCKNKISSK